MSGAEPDLSAATYVIREESHTLGNVLRWMIMKKYALFIYYGSLIILENSPEVEFCGYRSVLTRLLLHHD